MSDQLSPADLAKSAAAKHAATFVTDGMKLGLGTGSTANWLIKHLGHRCRTEGLRFVGVPTSTQTAKLAQAEGLELATLDQVKWLDLTIDGTDEFDADLNLIKGGGGALLREKIVATASDRMIVIADQTKQVSRLGAFPLPVEVVGFGLSTTQMLLAEMLEGLDVAGSRAVPRRTGDDLFFTDEGHHIIDLHLNRIGDARQLSLVLNQVPGVVENGLFVDICDLVILGQADGTTCEHGLNALDLTPALDKNIFMDLVD